jgi:trk system potassium uptake protein TrkA
MDLIIVGCGRVGSELANLVAEKNHDVVVIDRNPLAFQRLGDAFRGRTVQGDVRDRNVLLRAGIETADGFAAITPDDELNLVAAQAARDLFNVPNVVARVYNPIHTQAFTRANLQTVISSSWSAHRIEQLLTHPGITELANVGNGELLFLEVLVPDHMVGQSAAHLAQVGACQPAALVRGGSADLVSPDRLLEDGDLLVVATLSSNLPQLEALLMDKES